MSDRFIGLTIAAAVGLAALILKEDRCDARALQPYFNALHDDIKLSNVDENAVLRDKRELLIRELTASLPDTLPHWRTFNQGSYAMGTGIYPADGDFDIDVGIVFDCTREDISDPVELKRVIFGALSKGNRTVVIRRPCVTVRYMKGDVIHYHVDLAIYVKRAGARTLDLAMGKQHSAAEHCMWSEQDPAGLIDIIRERFSKAEAEQFRRCIRYLKAWRNSQFRNGGAPLSIALTCAAYAWFQPCSSSLWEFIPADANALRQLVNSMLKNIANKPCIRLPVAPKTNLLEKMTPRQIQVFTDKLTELLSTLDSAMSMPLTKLENACAKLGVQFGAAR